MRILYLINYAGKAGTEKYVQNLVEAFSKKDECHLCYNVAGDLSEQMEKAGIPLFQLEMKNPFDLTAAKKLAAYCKEHKIDVIHAQYPRENYIALLSKWFYNKVKVVYTCHLTLPTNKAWYFANKLMTPQNHHIISVCNEGRDIMIANGVDSKKISVIYNGVIPNETRIKNTQLKAELGLAYDIKLLTILARYAPMKGLDFLVDAIAELRKLTDIPFAVAIAGDGELYDAIADRIRSLGLGDVIFQLGYRTDTNTILNGSDIYLNTSRDKEALSFAILEAMNAGLPVVATNVGGNADLVQGHDLTCGYITEFGDVAGFANALRELLEDGKKRIAYSEVAREKIRRVFDLNTLIEDVYKTY